LTKTEQTLVAEVSDDANENNWEGLLATEEEEMQQSKMAQKIGITRGWLICAI
jgi:hypothetical protein